MTQKQINTFRQLVLDFYSANRRDLPWRQTTDPYSIMVSEIMLQQTQVDRVIPKYLSWIERFPASKILAESTLREVLSYWSGLGYNRRGQNLLRAAQVLESEHGGSFESFKNTFNLKKDPLTSLPGIGPYTAAAIRAFAFSEPVIMIETNIRTVYIHHFFPKSQVVSDQELMPIIEATLDRDNPKNWYNALMDYGTHLKAGVGNLNRQSKSYTKQAAFAGSDRELRGKVIRYLIHNSPVDTYVLSTMFTHDVKRFEKIIAQLTNEALIVLDENDRLLIK
jgi:A/G-specific adenine glycosylase